MPTDACQFFYECKGCGALLKPRAGDCCVFCSYGSAPCPPIQAASENKEGAGSRRKSCQLLVGCAGQSDKGHSVKSPRKRQGQ